MLDTSIQTATYVKKAKRVERIDAVKLIDYILEDAIGAGASDVHIEPWEQSIVVRLRVQGMLIRLIDLPHVLMDRISGRLKVMADMQRFRPVTPQEGHAPVDFESSEVQLRISVFPTKRGEKIVIRLFDTRDREFRLDSLGIAPEIIFQLKAQLDSPLGTILFTGPTGSGKTTAIYAALCHLTERYGDTISVSTVEDPVEFNLPMVSQAEVTLERGFTYPMALRSLMRQDPQVIMIGEIRDPETAAIGMQAGLTGHLVISTIHSPGTAGVFVRLINMGIEPFTLTSSVVAVVGLRLLRTTCPRCSEPYEPEDRLLRFLTPGEIDSAYFRRGTGCATCFQTGYALRSALAEMMVMNDSLREAILAKHPTSVLQEIAMGDGMKNLWQSGLEKVIAGELQLEELARVVSPDPVSAG